MLTYKENKFLICDNLFHLGWRWEFPQWECLARSTKRFRTVSSHCQSDVDFYTVMLKKKQANSNTLLKFLIGTSESWKCPLKTQAGHSFENGAKYIVFNYRIEEGIKKPFVPKFLPVEFIIKQMDCAYHLLDDSSSFDQCIFIRHRTLIECGAEDISLSRL